MNWKKGRLLVFMLAVVFSMPRGLAQTGFDLIPLGVYGGGDESNLSAYLLSEKDQRAYISLDAGTLRAGINKAIENGLFSKSNEYVLQRYIKGYFISHGHLDHLAGLVINSPDDTPKPIYGLEYTISILQNNYFVSKAWENFTDEGDEPRIGTYSLRRINDGEKFEIDSTSLTGRIFELSHVNPNKSSAILVTNSSGEGVLYLGDTGADRIEKTDRLDKLWTAIAPMVEANTLKAILIETSYDNSRDEKLLFGHLTPRLVNEELQNLTRRAHRTDLAGLKVIITHLKPGGQRISRIKDDFNADNPMKVQFIFPAQGQLIRL